ncbi:LA2681 family HEPN domain-containing protein [Enterobacter asburiae]|uniref:LA2681 family HEPN domain-containing protein n=1 Tax=Enterobacter asburiae TaxID=61645 RepID=UPI0011D1D658|nr:LA2681 family HEPN domain-containing protein [Enterobacter asburiae]
MLITKNELDEFGKLADQFIINSDHASLAALVERFTRHDLEFPHPLYEAHYLYCLGNCYSELYKYRSTEWYSHDLMNAIIYYRKALHTIPKIDWKEHEKNIEAYNNLRSMVETNLASRLSSQGRVLCCIPHYDKAISIDNNPVAILAKADNALFLGQSLYDNGHSEYHFLMAYKLVNNGIENINELYPEQRIPLKEGGRLFNFKKWFECTFEISAFDYFKEYNEEFKSSKHKQYFEWCAKNRLFLNDLNDVCEYPIVYQDVFSLPSFVQPLNSSLAMHEELAYHGNYDELKNDYSYARYLIFSSKDIPNEISHMFNSTFQHVDDMSYSINNLKVAQLKSAFRAVYSLFDKVAYLISRFFDLNDMKHDKKLSMDNLFRDFTSKNNSEWKPHKKLKDSDNHFIHALFYILKDIRKVGNSDTVTKWLDPNAVAFADIRNAMEHRSLKIVDDFGYELATSYNSYHDDEFKKQQELARTLPNEINQVGLQLKQAKKDNSTELLDQLQNQIEKLNKELDKVSSNIDEKEKLSSHSLLIPISQFESRLMQLISLARNSIMYLSLAIHFEERKRPKNDMYMPREIPLK